MEVCRGQQWGRVCDDHWDEQDSAVVCRQLGLEREGNAAYAYLICIIIILYECPGLMAFTGTTGIFTRDSMLPFVLDDLGCSGSEKNLLECLPTHNCGSSGNLNENAGVRCQRKGL